MTSLATSRLPTMGSECEATDDETNGSSSREELLQVFQTFDENGDGKITREELRRAWAKLGLKLTEAELLAMVEAVDDNCNGSIEWEEFLSLHRSLPAQGKFEEEEELLMEAFRVFDKNADGFISAQELQSIFSSLGSSQGMKLTDCNSMIKGVDLDGDGQVSFSEFKAMMKSKSLGRWKCSS